MEPPKEQKKEEPKYEIINGKIYQIGVLKYKIKKYYINKTLKQKIDIIIL